MTAGRHFYLRRSCGKFNLIIDEYIHGLTLDGLADSVGNVSEVGWAATRIDAPLADGAEFGGFAELTSDELHYWRLQIGAIVTEDDRGSVEVLYFTSQAEFVRNWTQRVEDADVAHLSGGDDT